MCFFHFIFFFQLDDQYCNNKEGHFQSNLSIPQKVDITLDGNQEHLLNTCHRLQKENETLAEQKKDLQNAYYRLQNENEIYLKELQTAKFFLLKIISACIRLINLKIVKLMIKDFFVIFLLQFLKFF